MEPLHEVGVVRHAHLLRRNHLLDAQFDQIDHLGAYRAEPSAASFLVDPHELDLKTAARFTSDTCHR
jgi:hypothetical protein